MTYRDVDELPGWSETYENQEDYVEAMAYMTEDLIGVLHDLKFEGAGENLDQAIETAETLKFGYLEWTREVGTEDTVKRAKARKILRTDESLDSSEDFDELAIEVIDTMKLVSDKVDGTRFSLGLRNYDFYKEILE